MSVLTKGPIMISGATPTDSVLSSESTNPVQNKVIAQELSAINTNLLQRFHIVKFQIETTGSSDFGYYVYVGGILEVEINRLGLTNLKAIIPMGCTKSNDNGNGGYIVPYSANGLESPIDMNYGINVKNQGTYTVNFLVVTY